MSTIATLVARIEGDNSGLTSTLQDSARKVKQFYGDALGRFDQGISGAGAARAKAAGSDIADKIIEGLGRTLETKQLDIKEQLYQGLIDKGEAQKLGDKAGASFNWGLSNALRELGDRGMLSAETRERIVNEYRVEGLRAGEAFARAQAEASAASAAANTARWTEYGGAISRNINRGMLASAPAALAAANNIERGLTGVGRAARVAGAEATLMSRSTLIGVSELARGVGRVAQAGQVGAFAMREFTGAAFRIGAVAGVWGEVIAVAATLGFAIYEIFSGARKEIDKTKKEFEDSIKDMVDTANNAGLIGKFRELEVGLASNGFGKGGGFTGSAMDLRGQLAEKNAMIANAKAAGNKLLLVQLEREAAKLEADLKPILAREDKLRDLILNPPAVEFHGTREANKGIAAVHTDANGPKHDLEAQKKEIDDIARAASRLSQTWESVAKTHDDSTGLLDRMLDLHRQIEARLKGMKDKTSDFAITLRRALTELDKNPFIAFITGASNGQLPLALPGLTSNGNTHTAFGTAGDMSATGPMAQMNALLRRIEQNGGVTGAPTQTVDAGRLTNLIGPGLAATFRQLGDDIKAQLLGTLTAAFGPLALLMRALEPALRVLQPLLDAVVAPLAAVAEVLVVGIKPILQLIFPIIRAAAIGLAFFSEIISRVTAGIATAIGKAIRAIGSIIAKIPFLGGLGHSIENAGDSILKFAAATYANADQMKHVRQQLESMTFGTTADAITGLGDAASSAASVLNDVPEGYKVALDRFLATDPRTMQPGAAAGSASSAGAGVVVQGDVYVDARAKSARELFDAVREQARTNARSQYGDATRAPDTLK